MIFEYSVVWIFSDYKIGKIDDIDYLFVSLLNTSYLSISNRNPIICGNLIIDYDV